LQSKQKFMGLTCKKKDIGNSKSELLIKIKSGIINPLIGENAIVENSEWSVYLLGSLVTAMREYDVCKEQPKLIFEENFLKGEGESTSELINFEDINSTQLNVPQKTAVAAFASLGHGLQVLQGPPGTGKTTTIVQLINILALREERVLVCAPSNKAVQVLATRFLKDFPDVKMVFAGRHEKLIDELRPVFIDNYKDQLSILANIAQEIMSQRQLINPIDEKTRVNIKNRFNTIKELYSKFKKVLDSLKYFYILDLDKDELNPYYTSINTIDFNIILKTKEELLEKLNLLNGCLSSLYDKISSLKDVDIALLNIAKVIFCTLSVSGRSRMRLMDPIDTLIVDEAAQATEVGTIIPFQHYPSKCLLVGDTKQLPAVIHSELTKCCHFDWSMIHRLLEECKYPHELLKIQYRMHFSIKSWPSRRFYNNLLEDGENISRRERIGLPKEFEPYVFINFYSYREQQLGKSFMNRGEAKLIIDILKYLSGKQIDIVEQVGVITFYAGQVECIKQELQNASIKGILPQTVDGFQGDERDIILISFVRANNRHNVGFLRDFRRLNVSITRAKRALIMVGNYNTLQGDPDLKSLLKDVKTRKCLVDASSLATKYWPSKPANSQQLFMYKNVTAKQSSNYQSPLKVENDRHGVKPVLN